MDKKEFSASYENPLVEIIELEAEQVFATSSGNEEYGDGDW